MHINFEQPLWLWGLLLIPLGFVWSMLWNKLRKANLGGLSRFIDKELLPHVLISDTNKVGRNTVGFWYALLVFFIIVALANPRWSYKDIDAFQPIASMVVLLDLSASMNADDISPSRIVRARQYIEDLINQSRGLKIGLVGFAGYPHLISPITDDLQTIKTYIPALDTDLTNKQGHALQAAFGMAADLLTNEPGEKKSILLISPGNFINDDFAPELKTLTAKNIQVHVLGIGTLDGAPYKTNQGNLQKIQGKLAVSKLNDQVLKDIAKQGQGIYTEAVHSDIGLRAILAKAEQRDQEHILAGKVRQWDDRYYLFLMPAALIFLFLLRRRAIYVIAIAVGLNTLNISTAEAKLPSFLLNSEQKGQQFYVDGNFAQAATAFKDPYHQGVALYRDGQYAQAEQAFLQTQRQEVRLAALFNAGNAQMQQKKWQAAIDSYEAVLLEEPDDVAAQHNLEIAKKMLEQEPEQENQDDCECKNKNKAQQNKQDKDQKKNNTSAKNDPQHDQHNSHKQQGKQQEQENEEEQEDEHEDEHENEREDEHENEQENEHEQESRNRRDSQKQQQQARNNKAEHEKEQTAAVDASINALTTEEEQRIEQWLNRVDSDIKIFLKNKFYVEDMIGAQ